MDKMEQVITDIRDTLMDANAVKCDPEVFQLSGCKDHPQRFIMPSGYRVTIDWTELAKALYYAGYRKVE